MTSSKRVAPMVHPSVLRFKLSTKRLVVTTFLLILLSGCRQTEQKPSPKQVFDIPPLIGKKITEVEAVLGTPTIVNGPNVENNQFPLNETFKTWSKDGAALIVQYDQSTGRIFYFYVAVGKESEKSSFDNKEEPLVIGNLKRDASNYHLKFIPNKYKPGHFWGLKAIPNT